MTHQPAADVPKERPLAPPEVELLWSAMRHLKAAADSLRLYPAGHPLVEEATVSAHRALESILSTARILTVSTPENDFVVNGIALDPKANRTPAQWLTAEFRRKEMRSLSFREGLRVGEIRSLLSILVTADAVAAAKAVAQSDIRHIVFDVRTYQRVTEHTMAPTGRQTKRMVKEKAPPPPPPPVAVEATAASTVPGKSKRLASESEISARIHALLRAPDAEFLTEATERWLPPLLMAVATLGRTDLATGLVDRLVGYLRSGDAAATRQAGFMASRAMTETSSSVKSGLVARLREPILAALARTQDAAALKALAEASRVWIAGAVAERRRPEILEFVAHGLKRKCDDAQCPATFRADVLAMMRALSAIAPNPALDAIKTGPPKLRQAAARVAGLMGPPLIPHLIETIVGHDDPAIRKGAAEALKEIGGTANADLAARVRPDAPATDVRRILEVFEMSGSANLAAVVEVAYQRTEPVIRDAAFSLIKRGERLAALAAVRSLFLSADRALRLEALMLAKELRLAELVADVVQSCEGADDEQMLHQACLYFRECPSSAALPILKRVFEKRTKVFGLSRGFTSKTRAAAVAAAAKINDPVVTKILEQAQEDRSNTIRRAAKPPPPP